MSFLPTRAMPVDVTPACTGLWTIFDSTNPSDHQAAREICKGCDVRFECDQIRKDSAEQSIPGSGPVGTWAGQLFSPRNPRKEKREVSDKELDRLAAENAARREATHCKRGHEFNEDNTYVNPNDGRRTCRICVAAGRAKWKRERGIPETKGKATHCQRGHEFTHENTKYEKDGRRRCRECRRSSRNAWANRQDDKTPTASRDSAA